MSSNTALGHHGVDPGTFVTTRPAVVQHGERAEAIDLASLLRRCLDDSTFCAMILHKFAARAGDALAALDRAFESHNFMVLAREAHTLQGVAANLSAARLRASAVELETAARQCDSRAAQHALHVVRSEMASCTLLVPELIAKIAASV